MASLLFLLKPFQIWRTTILMLCLMGLTHALVVAAPAQAEDATKATPRFPSFRHVDPRPTAPPDLTKKKLVLLTEDDFAPYSYRTPDGRAAGLSVDLAVSACAAMQVECSVLPKRFAELLPALLAGEGDALISGLRVDAALLKKTSMTRPYYWSTGRFAVHQGSQLRSTDVRALAGKRIGYVTGSSHGAFLAQYYARSTLTGFADEAALFAALKANVVDGIFGDNLRISYWLAGQASNSCCKALDSAYVDRDFFSRNLAFLVRKDDTDLAQSFDFALDRLQEDGSTSAIFVRYLPSGFF
jgi:polar amino acid transport system substrate-binding protein